MNLGLRLVIIPAFLVSVFYAVAMESEDGICSEAHDKLEHWRYRGKGVVFLVRPNGQGRSGSNVFVAGTLP